jgi:broad specificity phosphatase PhoE
MSVQIVFETHSTSVDNEQGLATGWLGGTLSPTGREQARELGQRRSTPCSRGVRGGSTASLRRAQPDNDDQSSDRKEV